MYNESPIERRIAASANQIRYVKAELAGAGTYMIPLGHLVQGPLDRDKLAAAARALILRHEALRTRFELGEGTITAIVAVEPNFRFHVVSLADRSLDAFRNLAIPLIFDRVDPREARLARQDRGGGPG